LRKSAERIRQRGWRADFLNAGWTKGIALGAFALQTTVTDLFIYAIAELQRIGEEALYEGGTT
jgi:hypothetical protein